VAVIKAATSFIKNLQEIAYRRHSALRTINGGMCWGFSLWRLLLEQLLLLGYQRMLNNSIFKGNLYFFNLLNITDLFCNQLYDISTLSYRQIRTWTFGNCTKRDSINGIKGTNIAYGLWDMPPGDR
jgi:hypothetical protein